jgi:hypothetical protein
MAALRYKHLRFPFSLTPPRGIYSRAAERDRVAMNSEAEAGPSTPRKKDDGAFGPLRYDDGDRENGEEWDDGTDRDEIKSAGPPSPNCDVAVRRGELAILKGAGASVVYEMAVRCFLDLGRPAVLVDGGCQADPYEVAAIAKRIGREMTDGGDGNGGTTGKASRRRRVDEDEVLRNIHVARAFTAHQLEALIVSRLPPMLGRIRPAFVGVMSIDVLFLDEELDRYEARIMQVRCVRTLRRLAREHNLMAAATESGARRAGRTRWW